MGHTGNNMVVNRKSALGISDAYYKRKWCWSKIFKTTPVMGFNNDAPMITFGTAGEGPSINFDWGPLKTVFNSLLLI